MTHSSYLRRPKWAVGAGVVITVSLMAVTSCSSSSGGSKAASSSANPGSSSAPSTVSAGIAAAQKAVDALTTMPTKIAITVPLSKTPPTGKKVFIIGPQNGDYQKWDDGFSEAAKALGWTPTVLTTPGSAGDYNGMAQQALQQGAQYLAVAGPVFPTNQPLVDAAKAAKVPLFYFSSDQAPQGEANWEFASVGASSEYVARGTVAADQAIVAANGKANTLLFNTPQYLVYQTLETSFKEEYAKNCSGCPVGVIDAPIADVQSGAAATSMVAYIRSHPDVNQIVCNNSAFCAGFPAKAKAAGITIGKGGIGLTLASASDPQIPWFADGTAISGQATPYGVVGWQLVDAMARYSVGDPLDPNWKAPLQEFLYTDKNTPAGSAPYLGPVGYQDQFKALWKV